MITTAPTRPLSRIFVHAAADAWSSSRPSNVAPRPDIGRQLQSSQSGSTLHEPSQITTPQIRSFLRWSSTGQRRLAQMPGLNSDRAPIVRTPVPADAYSSAISSPTNTRHRSAVPTRISRGSQIPIVQAAPPTFSHRGFLSLKAFGRRPPMHGTSVRPASETLNNRRPHAPQQKLRRLQGECGNDRRQKSGPGEHHVGWHRNSH